MCRCQRSEAEGRSSCDRGAVLRASSPANILLQAFFAYVHCSQRLFKCLLA